MTAKGKTNFKPRICGMLALLAAVFGMFALAPGRALAQDEGLGGSYITPFPSNDIYQLQVYGDWLAAGVLDGLVEAMGSDARLQIRRKHRGPAGLMRNEFAVDLQDLDEELKGDAVHIGVVMLGVQDRISVKMPNGKRAQPGTPEWREQYSQRVDRLMKVMKRRNVAVYWIGLPLMRRPDNNEDSQAMNEAIRERAYLNGIKYIDAAANFANEQGAYDAYGPDLAGKIRLLRENDGVHFTQAGNQKLAHFLERELKRDLTTAKNERSIPLAGNEAEQAQISPAKVQTPAAPGGAVPGKDGKEQNPSPPTPALAGAPGEQKADNGRINLKTVLTDGREEVVGLDILRPAIPASVVNLVTRRESPDKPSQMGEQILDQIAGGLTVMSSITPSSTGSTIGARPKLSPAQAPFFRVLVKGERLPPRRGRADDAAWPRPEPPPAAELPDGGSPAVRPGRSPAPKAEGPASSDSKG